MVTNAINVRKRSVAILFLMAMIAPAIGAISGLFDLTNLPSFVTPLLTIALGGFILSEIGVLRLLSRRALTKEPLRVFGIVVGVLVIIIGTLNLFEMSFLVLDRIGGVVSLLAVIYAVAEAIRKN